MWLKYNFMVSPYIRTDSLSDDGVNWRFQKLEYCINETLIDYVYKHKADENVTKEEIRALYAEYKREYDPIVAKINGRQC